MCKVTYSPVSDMNKKSKLCIMTTVLHRGSNTVSEEVVSKLESHPSARKMITAGNLIIEKDPVKVEVPFASHTHKVISAETVATEEKKPAKPAKQASGK